MSRCPDCGTENIEIANFCESCGKDLIDENIRRFRLIIVAGYIFSILGGFIGVIIGLFLFSHKNPYAKLHGKIMLLIFGIWMIIIAVLRIAVYVPNWVRFIIILILNYKTKYMK